VDGSRIKLAITNELKQLYEEAKNHTQTEVIQARRSVMYDVMNNFVLDGKLAPLKQGEGELALAFLKFKITYLIKCLLLKRKKKNYEKIYSYSCNWRWKLGYSYC